MKRFLRTLIALVISAILIAYSNITFATTMSDLKNQKSEVKNEITATQKKIKKITAEREETLKEVEKLINQIAEYQEDVEELNEKISKLQLKITETENQIKKDEEEYAKEDKALDQRLVAMYKTGETSYLDFLLSSANLVDFISSYYLVSEIADYDVKMLEQLEAHKQKIEKKRNELEADKKELDNSRITIISKRQGLQTMKNAKQQYVKDLNEDERKLEAQLSELATHEQTISRKIAKLQAEYDAAKARAGSGGSRNSNKAASSFGFGWPVENPYIGTGYGVSGSYWSSGHHTGVDFRASTGTPVYSVGDGQVVDCGCGGAYGYFVEVYHGNNVYSFYAHASRIVVSQGQYVSKGQQVMYSGATGNVTGPHLHFEIRTPGPRYANCVNPMPYLP